MFLKKEKRLIKMISLFNEDMILKFNSNFENNCKNIIIEHFDGKIDAKYLESIYNYICSYIDLNKANTDSVIHMIIDIYYRYLTNQNVNISEYIYLFNYSNSSEHQISRILKEKFIDDRNKLNDFIYAIRLCFPLYIIDSDKINKLVFLCSSASYKELKEELFNIKLCCELNKGYCIKGMLLEIFNLIDELEEIIKTDIFANCTGKVLQLYHFNK